MLTVVILTILFYLITDKSPYNYYMFYIRNHNIFIIEF